MPSGVANATRLPSPPISQLGGGVSYKAQLVIDRQTIGVSGNPGQVTLTLPVTPGAGTGFLVERLAVTCSGGGTPAVRVYIGNPSAQNEIEYSPAGTEDIADENSPIYVPAGATLTLQWTGAAAGAVCTFRAQYAVIQFVPATYGASGPAGGA